MDASVRRLSPSADLTSHAQQARNAIVLGGGSGPALFVAAVAEPDETWGARAWRWDGAGAPRPAKIAGLPDGDLDSLAGDSSQDLAVLTGSVIGPDGAPRAFALTSMDRVAWRAIELPPDANLAWWTGAAAWEDRALIWGQDLAGRPVAILIEGGTARRLTLPDTTAGARVVAAAGHGDSLILASESPPAMPLSGSLDGPLGGHRPGDQANQGVTSHLFESPDLGGTWRPATFPAAGYVAPGGLMWGANDPMAAGCLTPRASNTWSDFGDLTPTGGDQPADATASKPLQWVDRPLCEATVWAATDGASWRAARASLLRGGDAEATWLMSLASAPEGGTYALAARSQGDEMQVWRGDGGGWAPVACLPGVGVSSPTGDLAVAGGRLIAALEGASTIAFGQVAPDGTWRHLLSLGGAPDTPQAVRAFANGDHVVISARTGLLSPVLGGVETKPMGTVLTAHGTGLDYAHWQGLDLAGAVDLRFARNPTTGQQAITANAPEQRAGSPAAVWLGSGSGTWRSDTEASLQPGLVVTALGTTDKRWIAAFGNQRLTDGTQAIPTISSPAPAHAPAEFADQGYPLGNAVWDWRTVIDTFGDDAPPGPDPTLAFTASGVCTMPDGNWLVTGAGTHTVTDGPVAMTLFLADGDLRSEWAGPPSTGVAACVSDPRPGDGGDNSAGTAGGAPDDASGALLLDADGRRIYRLTTPDSVATSATLPASVRLISLARTAKGFAAGGEERSADHAGPIVALSADGVTWRIVRLPGSAGLGSRAVGVARLGTGVVAVQAGSRPPAAWMVEGR